MNCVLKKGSKSLLNDEGRYLFLLGRTMADELNFRPEDFAKEKCALFAAVDVPEAAYKTFLGLGFQQKRGEESCGIVSVWNNNFYIRKRLGLISDQFKDVKFDKSLPGNVAIGHNRYGTSGCLRSITNIQPFIFERTKWGKFVIAHNGTLNNTSETESELLNKGAIFQSTSDTEIIGHLIAQSKAPTFKEAILEALDKVQAAYSLLILTPDHLYAIRDRFGLKPLSIARHESGFFISSENYFFNQIPNTRFEADIRPGEMIIFDKRKKYYDRLQYAEANEHFDIFEGIYFSNPRSTYNGYFHEDFRQQCGMQVFRENPHIRGDAVIPVLESGQQAAIGFSKVSKILYKEYVMRVYNTPLLDVSRSFTCPNQAERELVVMWKFDARKGKIKGKHIIVVDDSWVRGTTMKIFVKMLRDAGAAAVTVVIACPPIVDICPNGNDFRTRPQLGAYRCFSQIMHRHLCPQSEEKPCAKSIAECNVILEESKFYSVNENVAFYKATVEEMRREIEADGLYFLTLAGLEKVVSETYKCGICTGCFGGKYPIIPDSVL